MHSTNKVLLFVLAMTTIVALVLSLLFYGLQGRVKVNEEVYNKKAILSAVKTKLSKPLDEMSNEEIMALFENQVSTSAISSSGKEMSPEKIEALGYGGNSAEDIDMAKEKKKPLDQRSWPLFKFNADDGKAYYIMAMRGNGLWDEIWGYIALEEDLETIAGVAFDHKAETPGLGAEIKDSKAFQNQFIGTKIKDPNGDYAGILVRKGGAKNRTYEVDGLTGATITADGVTAMMKDGVQGYAPYFKSLGN